jgi:hypothetical protein
MGSIEFFEENPSGKKFKLLSGKTEDELIAFEKETASRCSPGPVADNETVYHQILDPTNLNEERTGLAPKSFDSATGIGMSVNRIKYATIEEISALGRARADKHNADNPDNAQPRSFWGLVPISVALVRSMISRVTNTRGMFVFDTALPHDISHADIAQLTKDEKKSRAVRLELYDLVKGAAFKVE